MDRIRLLVLVVVGLGLIAAGCGSQTAPVTGADTSTPVAGGETESGDGSDGEGGVGGSTPIEASPILVPLSLYVLVDADDPDSSLSSTRTVAEVEGIADQVGQIWAQAAIEFGPVNVFRIEVPGEVLAAIAQGDTGPFFDQVGTGFDVPQAGQINGFYVNTAFGVNGFAPNGTRVFFVVDRPSVPDERVSSHEIGHLFGLRHDQVSPGRLMFSGTDGVVLTDTEKTVARYGASGLVQR